MNQKEIVGKHCYELWHHRKEPCQGCVVLKAKETRQPQSGEISTPDGRIWSLRGYPVLNEQGDVVNLIELGMDVTAQKRAELRFESYVTQSPTPVFIANSAADYTFVNPAACDLLGYTEDEFLAMSIKDVVHPDNYEKNFQPFSQLLEGKHVHEDISLRHKDGRQVEVILDALMLDQNTIIGFGTDVTERKKMEQELKEKTAFLSKIMATSPVGIVTVDKTGNITYANNRAEQILGLVKDEITARTYDAPLWNHIDLDGSPLADEKQPFNIVKESLDTVLDIQHGITWPDGTVVLLSINATPIKDHQGRFNGMLATMEDITEMKKSEDKIGQQLKEKEILLKEVHHRIKNNVYQIEGLLTLQAESTDDADVKAALQMARSRVQGIRVVYDKLLIGQDYQEISVKDYTESLITSLVSVFPESGTFTIEKKIADFKLNSKKAVPVGIIINELLTNVFKYAFKTKDHNHVLIELVREKNEVTLTVQDNGVGMDERVVADKSPGFGLAIVKMLTEQLGGTYTVASDNGTRSVLTFEI